MNKKYLNRIKIMEYKDLKKDYLMNVFTYIPEGNIKTMKIIFVMSGCLRDALNYLKLWIDVANQNKFIIIAPEFDKAHYSIADHEYGNIINIDYDYKSQDIYTPIMNYHKEIKDENEWIYSIIDDIYMCFINENSIENNGYIMFGHSSGSQFAHRFMMFGNSKYCKLFLCANAGLYTFYDDTKEYPYGIRNLEKYHTRILETLTKKVYILAGELDLDTKLLNNLPSDIQEGINRYERAKNYFISAKNTAEKHKINFNWNFVSMPNVPHNSKEVIPFAINIINENFK